MKTIHRIMLVLALLLPGLLRAEDLFKGATTINLPFPPGGREIVRLVIFNGDVIGVLSSDKHTPIFFRPSDMTVVADEPFGEKLTAMLVDPGHPLLADVAQQCAYSIDDTGKLVKLDINGLETAIGQVAGTRPFEDKTGFQISHAIVTGPDGAIYTAGDKGAIFKYDPAANKLENLKVSLPAMKGREPWASLDAGAFGPDGLLYGGTFDGYLFTFNPKTNTVVNLGKPFRAQRIRGLAFRNGKLYGIGGDDDGMPRSFAYDPATRGFELGGAIPDPAGANPILEPIGAFLGLPDGTIYFSTTGRLANLYIWKP